MKKLTLSLLFICSFLISISQRPTATCNICLSGTSFCNTTFNLTTGSSYTFTTDVQTGAVYSWTTAGGISIIGASNGSSVQVQANTEGGGFICLTKIVGTTTCCICYPVNITSPVSCPQLYDVHLWNEDLQTQDLWCCDNASNYLIFDMTYPGTATVIFTDLSTTPNQTQTFYGMGSGIQNFYPSGAQLFNHLPPTCGDYLVLVINDCNPENTVGKFFTVQHCVVGKQNNSNPKPNLAMDIFPNPATQNAINIKLTSTNPEALKADAKVTFRLVSITTGKIAKTLNMDKTLGSFSMNTTGIEKGNYVLFASIGEAYITKNIIIK
jgi:hypothetical protein